MSESTLPPTSDSATPPSPKKKRGRRWLKVIGVLLLILILLVLCAPMIISTGAVKNIVVGKVNEQLNGRLEIADWSIGWTSGVKVTGVKVFDESNTKIAELKSFSTPLSLIGAARGNIDLGETVVDIESYNARIDKDGQINFAKLAKTSPAPAKTEAGPKAPKSSESDKASPLPKVKGHFKLVGRNGTVQQEGKPTLYVTAIDGDATILDLNQPIAHSLNIAMKVGEAGQPGNLSVKGTASAIKNDVVDLNTANIEEAITWHVDLSAAAPFIPPSAGISPTNGTTDGQINFVMKDGKAATLSGQIDGKSIALTGPALKGDTYNTSVFQIALGTINIALPNGLGDVNAITVKADKPITATFDQGSASIDVNLPLSGVMNLAAKKAPGTAGSLVVDAKVDIKKLADALPHTIKLQEGVKLASGNFHELFKLTMTEQVATFEQTADITDIAGQNNGKPVSIKPINLTVTGQVGESKTALPGVKDLKLNLTSGFATANFTAATLDQLKGEANGELAKVQSEFGQIIDFGNMKMAGAFNVTTNTQADLQDASKPAKATLTATLTNLRIDGLADQPVQESRIAATLDADILRSDTAVLGVKNVKLTAQVGDDADSPTVNLLATGDADFQNGTNVSYNLQECRVVLAKLQRKFGPLVNALRDKPDLGLGTLTITSAGSMQQSGDNLTATVKSLAINESNGLIAINQDGELSVKKTGPSVAPAGKIKIDADLVKLSDVVQKVSAGKAKLQVNGSEQKLASGKLTGTIQLASATATTNTITIDMAANDLSVQTKDGPSERQSITFGLKTTPAADFSSISDTRVYAKAPFADVQLNDVSVTLPKAPSDAKGPALPVVNGAKLTVDISDVGPLNSLLQAFTPPATQPSDAPITIPRGAVQITGNISHENTATVLNIQHITTKELRLQKGPNIYKVKDIDVALSARADISGDTSQTLAEQLREISVTSLTGHLGLAEVTMPQPIKITTPLGKLAAAGTIAINGNSQDATSMLEILAGKKSGELYPFATAYNARLDLSTTGNTVTLKGPIEFNDFKAFDATGATIVTEPKIAIALDVSADTVAHNAKSNSIRVETPGSGAVQLIVTGGVNDWEIKRQMDGVVVRFNGDWDKLWPIIKPLIPADQRQQVADLALGGKFERVINVSGSYPANVPFNEGIKSLNADGSFVIATAKWPSNGIDASNLEIPFTLKDGILRTVYNKPEGQNLPSPMTVNTGEVNIGNLSIDLTQLDPRLTAPPNYLFARKIALNNAIAAQLGKLSPLFFGADKASGLFSLTLIECKKLPLSKLATLKVPENDGTIRSTYSVDQLQINGTVATLIGAISETGDSLRGDVKDATIEIANGEVTQDTKLTLGQQGNFGLRLYGGVNLESLRLDNFFINLPPSMLKQIDKNLRKYLPDGVDIALKGAIGKGMTLDSDKTIKNLIGEAAKKALTDNLLGGGKKKDDKNATTQPDKKADDPIGGILDQLGKKKDKKKK